MAERDPNFGGAGTNPVYLPWNLRVPQATEAGAREYGVLVEPWHDLVDNKVVVGGMVAADFVADLLTPLKFVAGYYVVADMTTDAALVVGLLEFATDANGAERFIGVIKGGNVKSDVGYFYGKTDAEKTAVAEALGGRYDAQFQAIRI